MWVTYFLLFHSVCLTCLAFTRRVRSGVLYCCVAKNIVLLRLKKYTYRLGSRYLPTNYCTFGEYEGQSSPGIHHAHADAECKKLSAFEKIHLTFWQSLFAD